MLRRLPLIIFTALSLSVNAQDSRQVIQEDDVLLQITGYILEDSSQIALPYAHILNLNKGIGKVSNVMGYYSIIASQGDTLKISNIGYHDHYHVVEASERHIVFNMIIDVQQLPETEIRPWPKSVMSLRQELKNKQLESASTDLVQNMTRAGFKPPPTHPTPPPPTLLNPVSFIYERLIKKIQERRPKKKMIDQMPDIE